MGKYKDKGEHQLHRDSVDKHTIHLENSDIERMPDSDEDYRLPRKLPDTKPGYTGEDGNDEEELLDGETDISPVEIALLEAAEWDATSDETLASDLLDDTDEEGEELNEGPAEDNVFDTGEDLDMPNSVTNPDIDADEEDE